MIASLRMLSCCSAVLLQGIVEVYKKQYSSAGVISFLRMTELALNSRRINDRLGTSLAMSANFIIAGGPNRRTESLASLVRMLRSII